ncbi:PAS domain S-box protein [Rhodopirellula sp. JC740]|uniref:histidine kinase n=1 Tax=Rhodopirellula halodulae TaxID=2894198 RepID=A0ABS8NBN5_9BACT|nr:PAS domain S-box protein [Rhodopirellula sp. JC740]MCC9640954.1 PAS domain S-box protein [Rhodopirellula sp. JC740]
MSLITPAFVGNRMQALRDYLQSNGEMFFDVLELATTGFYLRPIATSGEQASHPPLFSQLCFTSLGHTAPDSEDTLNAWVELIHPDDREEFRRHSLKCSDADGSSTPRVYRLRTSDGQYRYTEEKCRIIRNEERDESFRLAVLHDIHDRRLAEQENETRHREMQTILDTIPTLVWFKDRDHRILRVNRAAAESSGLSAEEIEGKLTKDVYPSQGARYQASDLTLLQGEQPVKRVYEVLENRDGDELKMLIDKYIIPAHNEEDERILVVGTDVTEIEEAQEALAKQEAQFRNLFEGSPLGSLLIDSNRKIRLLNSQLMKIYRITPSPNNPIRINELIPEYLLEQITPPTDSLQLKPIANTQIEFETTRGDGTRMRVSLVAAAIEIDGTWMTLATFSDITERHQVSLDLQTKQAELERSNEDLDRFAYIASHDLKAPLRGIMHLVEWIEEDMPPNVGQDVREHLEKLQSQAKRMDTLLNDLLAYARVTRQNDGLEWVDLNQLLPQLFQFMSPPPSMSLELPHSLPNFTTARGPLEQIFRNLFGNAIKHATGGSRVRVTAKVVEGVYQFSIQDDGPGIPDGTHERIFGMFQTLESGSNRRGTGMGLHLVKRLVQVQGGDAWADANESSGATIHFTWPMEAKSHAKAS